jgi:hypothetical protein
MKKGKVDLIYSGVGSSYLKEFKMKQIKKDIKKAEENINTILTGLSEKYEDVNFELDYESTSVKQSFGFSAGTTTQLGNVKITASIK